MAGNLTPEPRQDSTSSGMIQTVKSVLSHPDDFFEAMPREGGYAQPVIFTVVMNAINGLLGAVTPGGGFWMLLTPVLAVPFLFLQGAIFCGLGRVFGGSGSYEACVRMCAYASAIALFTWIPFLGFLAALYGLYITFHGVKSIHQLPGQKAGFVVAIPILVAMLFGVVFGLVKH